MRRPMTIKDKQFIIFDLDKTLSESKQPMDDEMATLVRRLLDIKKVAIISGGSFKQFQTQFVPKLTQGKLHNLFLFPTCGSAFYRFENGELKNIYTEALSEKEKARIFGAFEKMFDLYGFSTPKNVYGELVEDRGTQVTFSAFGSRASLSLKETWDPDRSKRLAMIRILSLLIPEFEIRTGGTTSIDVTREGIDKAYGIRQMEKHLGISRDNMLFIGDDLGEGGNDHPVIATGVAIAEVKNPAHTKELICSMIGSGA